MGTAQIICDGEIDGVIAIERAEGSVINGDGGYGSWNQNIGIRISVTVSVRGQIVLEQKSRDVEVLSDRNAVVPGNSWSKVLRCLDAAGRGFGGKTGDRSGTCGTARGWRRSGLWRHSRRWEGSGNWMSAVTPPRTTIDALAGMWMSIVSS